MNTSSFLCDWLGRTTTAVLFLSSLGACSDGELGAESTGSDGVGGSKTVEGAGNVSGSHGTGGMSSPGFQYPIQLVLNIHNHSPAGNSMEDATVLTDPDMLHCLIRSWLRVADGWMHLQEEEALSDIKFSFMLDGQFPAWNTFYRYNQEAGGDFCGDPETYLSKYIDDTENGANAARAFIDFATFLSDGHSVGNHAHCHRIAEGVDVPGYPSNLFWEEDPCEDNVAIANEILDQVQTEIVTALEGLNYTPTSIHQTMGDLDWRVSNGYKDFDGGFDALLMKNVTHALWNPYRPCCANTTDQDERCPISSDEYPTLMEHGGENCDPEAAQFLNIPELAQMGASNAHGKLPDLPTKLFYERAQADPSFTSYGTNNELPLMKKTFWMLHHERRIWEQLGLPPRVWVIGYATHDSRISSTNLRYDSGYTTSGGYPQYDPNNEVEGEGTLPQFWGWVNAKFIAEKGVAEFANFDDVLSRFEAWEQSNTGASIGQNGYEGPSGQYPYELKFNRMLGPGNVQLEGSLSTNESLVLSVHDTDVGGYNMSKCIETAGPYSYGLDGSGKATRREECQSLGSIVDRYVEIWTESSEDVARDVRDLCGMFAGCDDPYVPVLAYDQDDMDIENATFERASVVTASMLPRLVVCGQACCSSASACGDAGFSP